MKRVILDLRGLVIHSFYRGTPSATVLNEAGERVTAASHAVNEFILNYLRPLLMHYQPIDIIAVLEGAKSNSRRRAVYPDYKQKPEQDAEDAVLVAQKTQANSLVEHLLLGLGVTLVKTPYAEADDTIAYLVERLEGSKVVYTVDKDLLQLHSSTCQLMITDYSTGTPTPTTVFKGMELHADAPPEMVRLYKSIVGDPTDQYGGVKGAGEGAFITLLQAYGYDGMLELDQIILKADQRALEAATQAEDRPKVRKIMDKLVAQFSEWRTCHHLARLHPEWMEQSYGEKVVRPQWAKRVPSEERVKRVLDQCGLTHYWPDFSPYVMTTWLLDQPTLEDMHASGQYGEMLQSMKDSPLVAFDWETYDKLKHEPYQEAKRSGQYVDMINQVLTGGSFCFGPNLQYCFYMPALHRDTANVSDQEVLAILKHVSGNKTRMVAHHGKFEMVVAKTNWGFEFPDDNLPEDTLIMSSYVNENGDGGLKKLSKAWLNYDQTNYNEIVPVGSDMRDVSGEEVMNYGCDDSVVCAHMAVVFKLIQECEKTRDFYKEHEPFFDQALLVPFCKGIRIDYARLAELERVDDELFDKTDHELRELLAKHCGDYNEAGFWNIWPEIESFIIATGRHKDKAEEDTQKKLAEQREKVWQACRYIGFAPPKVEISKGQISKAAQSLGFPPVRSLAPKRIEDWISNLHGQLARQEGKEYSPKQRDFLVLLGNAGPTLWAEMKTGVLLEDSQALFDLIQKIYNEDRSLWVGDELNVGSSLQMAMTFYGKMNLPILIHNQVKDDEGVRSQFDLEGAPSTNEIAIRTWLTTLEESSWQYQVLMKALVIRGIRTRRQLYYRPYPLWQSPIDGNIHPGIRNCGTITLRPSSGAPNVFQVSKIKDDGRMRQCFIPLLEGDVYVYEGVKYSIIKTKETQLIVSLDWVQQELAILGGLSQDPNLLACYTGDDRKDVHSMTAQAIMNMGFRRRNIRLMSYEEYIEALNDKTHELHEAAFMCRKKYAKTTNFLIVYGGSAAGLARKVIVPIEMAQEFVDAFNTMYPGVPEFQKNVIAFARRHGYVLTAYGTRKHCDGIWDKSGGTRAAWERQAINAPIQSTAACVLKELMRKVVKQRIMQRTGGTILAPVYDEVVASVPASRIFEYSSLMREAMSIQIPNTNVILDTSVSIGRNWGQQIELKTFSESSVIEAIEKELPYVI